MNYSNNPGDVRVDFFKPYGKWYETISMPWLDYGNDPDSGLIHDIFIESLRKVCALEDPTRFRCGDMTAVCLNPYHKHEHPLMLTAPWALHATSAELRANQFSPATYPYVVDEITLKPDRWREGEDGRLLATIEINEISFHVEAIPVWRAEDLLEGRNEAADELLGKLNELFTSDKPFRVMKIRGDNYCVFAYPYRE